MRKYDCALDEVVPIPTLPFHGEFVRTSIACLGMDLMFFRILFDSSSSRKDRPAVEYPQAAPAVVVSLSENAESIKEIFAKTALSNHFREIPMGRGDQTQTTDPTSFECDPAFRIPVLKSAQQFWLQLRLMSPISSRTTSLVSQLESAFLLHESASKGPFFMPEEFALQQA